MPDAIWSTVEAGWQIALHHPMESFEPLAR